MKRKNTIFSLKKNIITISSISIIVIMAIVAKMQMTERYHISSQLANGILLVISISLLTITQTTLRWVAEKIFRLPIKDPEKIIDHLNKSQEFQLNAHSVCKTTISSLMEIFDLPAAAIFVYHENEDRYLTEYSRGLDFSALELIISDHRQEIELLTRGQEQTYLDGSKKIPMSLLTALKNEKVDNLLPLALKNKNVAIIALSRRNRLEDFGYDDWKIIKIICDQSAISLENAMLYDKAQQFNASLKSEVEAATKDLREANTRLKKIDKSKSDFISIASHQLRTPLTVIKGFTSMILEGSFGPIPEKQVEPLKMVYQANDRLIQLIENLLNISRIEAGKLQFKYADAQLENIVDDIVNDLRTNAKQKGLALNWTKPSTPLPAVNIDEEKIRQVVMNLVENAVKYTNEGSVDVKLEKIDNRLEFVVSDTGLGIRSDDLSKLFQKFSRGTGSTALKEGTGLGLYVARQMIEIHKGKIWAESDGENKGSRFIFQLPINT